MDSLRGDGALARAPVKGVVSLVNAVDAESVLVFDPASVSSLMRYKHQQIE